jgi:endonuclease/exonuclease/phosphatase family metal-dependent hydrolase
MFGARPVAIAAVTALLVGLAAPAIATARTPRVMTWNIKRLDHSGSTSDGLRAVVSRLGKVRPHVIALQEVCGGQTAAIARALNRKRAVRRRSIRYRGVFGPVRRNNDECADDGWGKGYGQAILSRGPLRGKRNRVWRPTQGDSNERRGVLAVTTRIRGSGVRVFDTHMPQGFDCEIYKKVRRVARLAARSRRTLVMGDFNVTPPEKCRAARIMGPLYRRFREADPQQRYTIGERKLDYIFFRGFRRLGASVPNSDASDHRPLIARLRPR